MRVNVQNTFHDTHVVVQLTHVLQSETWQSGVSATTGTVSKRQWDRIWRTLCGMHECPCWTVNRCNDAPAGYIYRQDGTVDITFYTED